MEAIVASIGAAIALRIDEQTGKLETGKQADHLTIHDSPREELHVPEDARNAIGVFQDGNCVVDRPVAPCLAAPSV